MRGFSIPASLGLLLIFGVATSQGQQAKTPAASPTLVKPPPGVKVTSDIPTTGSELEKAFLAAANQACDLLPSGEAMAINSFMPALLPRDQRENKGLKTLPNPSTRRQMFTVGVEVAAQDLSRLPALSAGTILDYVKTHYVSIQARIQKDAARGTLYFHHRPIAATGTFTGARLSEDFSVAVAGTVRELHAIGCYVPSKIPPTPENLRTMVLIHKHLAVEKNVVRPGADRVEAHYELVFVRGRSNLAGNQLDMHVFTTSDERRKLHYVKTGFGARRPEDCTLKAEVMFTKFGVGAIEPIESAMRRQVINSRSVYDISTLDAYVKTTLKLNGTALENLNEILDAIIDNRIRATGATAPSNPAIKTVPPPVVAPAK